MHYCTEFSYSLASGNPEQQALEFATLGPRFPPSLKLRRTRVPILPSLGVGVSRGRAGLISIQSEHAAAKRAALFPPVLGVFLGDVGFERLGGGDVRLTRRGVALLLAREPAAVQCRGHLRQARMRGVEV